MRTNNAVFYSYDYDYDYLERVRGNASEMYEEISNSLDEFVDYHHGYPRWLLMGSRAFTRYSQFINVLKHYDRGVFLQSEVKQIPLLDIRVIITGWEFLGTGIPIPIIVIPGLGETCIWADDMYRLTVGGEEMVYVGNMR